MSAPAGTPSETKRGGWAENTSAPRLLPVMRAVTHSLLLAIEEVDLRKSSPNWRPPSPRRSARPRNCSSPTGVGEYGINENARPQIETARVNDRGSVGGRHGRLPVRISQVAPAGA